MPSYFHLSILPLISITKNVAIKRTASWHPKAIALYFLQQKNLSLYYLFCYICSSLPIKLASHSSLISFPVGPRSDTREVRLTFKPSCGLASTEKCNCNKD